jgi:hypothetical protein
MPPKKTPAKKPPAKTKAPTKERLTSVQLQQKAAGYSLAAANALAREMGKMKF